jgi:hypothetical protein
MRGIKVFFSILSVDFSSFVLFAVYLHFSSAICINVHCLVNIFDAGRLMTEHGLLFMLFIYWNLIFHDMHNTSFTPSDSLLWVLFFTLLFLAHVFVDFFMLLLLFFIIKTAEWNGQWKQKFTFFFLFFISFFLQSFHFFNNKVLKSKLRK